MSIINNYVFSFIKENCPEIAELWKNEQKNFDKIITEELKKSKKSKKVDKKPSNAPKGPRSSYILFCIEERPKINKEFPNISNQDKVKVMAERWNKAKEDDKIIKHFKLLADEDKKRAEKERDNYVPSDKGYDEKQKKKVKKNKTGYIIFCENEREKVKKEGFIGKNLMTELAIRWKTLKDDDEDMYTEYMEKALELKNVKEEKSEDEKPKKKVEKKVIEDSDISEEEIVDEE